MRLTMIKTIKDTIHPDFYLSKEGRFWQINDNFVVKLKVENRHSIAFSLDKINLKPFRFFGASPPRHITKMCDAIVALQNKNQIYLFIVEQKTAHSGNYKKQLINGKLFCQWLFSLYRQHDCLQKEQKEPIYIGLLIWQPRENIPPEGMSTHQRQPINPITVKDLDLCYEARNLEVINLPDIYNPPKKSFDC